MALDSASDALKNDEELLSIASISKEFDSMFSRDKVSFHENKSCFFEFVKHHGVELSFNALKNPGTVLKASIAKKFKQDEDGDPRGIYSLPLELLDIIFDNLNGTKDLLGSTTAPDGE